MFQDVSSSFAELEASIAGLNISRKSNVSTPLNSTTNHVSTSSDSTANQQRDSDNICVTGTPSLSGTRTVALSQSDMSSLKITVTFGGDGDRKSPCEVSGSDQQIKSPRDETVTKEMEDSEKENEIQEHVSEIEKQIASPCSSKSLRDDHDKAVASSEKDNKQSKQISENSSDNSERDVAHKLRNNHQQADDSGSNHTTGNNKIANAGKIVMTATKPTTTQSKRDSSSVSDMEINRGSVTESPSANIFRNRVNSLSMTPLSELEQESEAKPTPDNDGKGKNSSLLVSDISTDKSIGNESEMSECCSSSREDDSTQTSVVESGAEDRISSANTSHNKSALKDSKHNLSVASANNNTSQCHSPKEEEGKTVAKALPQVQRILDAHDQNSLFNQSLSELDNMAVDVEATSTPAAGKSKTMKVVNTLRLVTVAMVHSLLVTVAMVHSLLFKV